MKNLASCTPTEFAAQTVKIKNYVAHWFKVTDVAEIRKRLPDIPAGATDEEKKALIEEQARKNMGEIIEASLADHPAETVGLLALLCFVPVEEVDNHTMDEYFDALADMIESRGVMRFFTSLLKLVQKNGT